MERDRLFGAQAPFDMVERGNTLQLGSREMAENGKECLNKILECGQKFCAVLLDVVMPVMGGIEVLKNLTEMVLLIIFPSFLLLEKQIRESSSEHMNSA